jgi:hypothetical protein
MSTRSTVLFCVCLFALLSGVCDSASAQYSGPGLKPKDDKPTASTSSRGWSLSPINLFTGGTPKVYHSKNGTPIRDLVDPRVTLPKLHKQVKKVGAQSRQLASQTSNSIKQGANKVHADTVQLFSKTNQMLNPFAKKEELPPRPRFSATGSRQVEQEKEEGSGWGAILPAAFLVPEEPEPTPRTVDEWLGGRRPGFDD